MGVTYTAAIERDARREFVGARTPGDRHVLMAATTLATVLAIGLAYSGRMATRVSASGSVVNLNAATEARQLEAALAPAFPDAGDRRFAASRVYRFIASHRAAGSALPNVGALLAASVDVSEIDAATRLVVYKARLRDARARATEAGTPSPRTLSLLTATDLALVKPLAVVRTPASFGRQVLGWGAAYVAAFWGLVLFWWVRGSRGDFVLLTASHVLTGIGFALLVSRPDPVRDSVLFVRYAQGVVLGAGAFGVISALDFRRAIALTLSYIPLLGALVLSAVLLIFGDGPGGAKVNLGPVQPIEAIRLFLALFLAGYFARRWEVLRQVRARQVRNVQLPSWLNLPRLDYVLPVVIGVGAALLLFFLQRDLGPALLLCCVFLSVYVIARRGFAMAACGLAMLVAGFYVGYALDISATVSARVQMWQSAWDNSVRGGSQVAQAIWALASGGLIGSGLGLGETRYLPAGHTDLVLAAVGEELGFVGLLAVATVFVVMAWRGFGTALRSTTDYGFFLAATLTLFLVFPVIVMAAGLLGLVPLTGLVTPFLSYGGSAMVANFASLGLLTSIRSGGSREATTAPFRTELRRLSAGLAGAGAVLIGALTVVQVIRADDYLVRPHLGIQADGGRRYQYNPRVLDVLATLPRGTVYDRSGLPLATSDRAIAARAVEVYRGRGIEIRQPCRLPSEERCYPLGGAAFHLLGDAITRRNWSASNTAYIERDAQDRLRGFDDRATSVERIDASGRSSATVRRDYRELIPVVRHRHDRNHPAVKAFLGRPRDVRLSIDAPLQSRVSSIVARYAARSATGHAAAVVVDAQTGELLASASYPAPLMTGQEAHANDEEAHLLDRARFGLYPPGSTFKLVTAAAALRQGAGASGAAFTCTSLPGGRVGSRIPRWGIVRDDVLNTHPHGTIGMREGLVRSCNGYFAQLALRVGPDALQETATLLGISLARDNSAARLRGTLAHAGYGQGDVVATPLRIARAAAAIANGGVIREAPISGREAAGSPARVLLRPAAAAVLGQHLRDVVLTGSGRSLASHPWRIAGKTGTAEVSGAPSHAWFAGYAPHGAATKQIAFAVVIENAGYGGLAAAPAAGEIVTAAAQSGLLASR